MFLSDMFPDHVNEPIERGLDLHASLVHPLLVLGLPLADPFEFVRELYELVLVPGLLLHDSLLEYPYLFPLLLVELVDMRDLHLPGLLLLGPLGLGLLDLPQLYLDQVLLVLDPQLLPLHELVGVLRVCQLPLSLVKLVLQ